MLEDQGLILRQILDLADYHRVNGILISGDIYDKLQPSGEAVELFDSFLTEIRKRNLLCCAVSGNHDAAERIAYGSRIMADSNIHLSPMFHGSLKTITVEDEFGPLQIHLMPFLKPMLVRPFFPEVEPHDYQAAIAKVLGSHPLVDGVRHILLAHQFVAGGAVILERSESETQMVGGVDQIDYDLFRCFDYVALGHLHKPQKVSRETMRYSGSPLAYSFSEADHPKTVPLLHFRSKGDLEIELLPLHPKHEMRTIQGSIAEVLSPEFLARQKTDDYLHVTLTDFAVVDAMAKLRGAYPNIMRLEFLQDTVVRAEQSGFEPALNESPYDLFKNFYLQQHQRALSEPSDTVLRRVLRTGEEVEA
jgi:exonuclease SbcD